MQYGWYSTSEQHVRWTSMQAMEFVCLATGRSMKPQPTAKALSKEHLPFMQTHGGPA